MDTRILVASNNGKMAQNEPVWNLLTDKEKLTLLAMLSSKSDAEAISRSPIRKTQYFQYKKKLEPYKKQLVATLMDKALEVLQGSTLRAAEVLQEHLESDNPKISQHAAESILDRTVGRPFIAEQQKMVSQTLNFHLIGVEQSKIDALFQPKNINPLTINAQS